MIGQTDLLPADCRRSFERRRVRRRWIIGYGAAFTLLAMLQATVSVRSGDLLGVRNDLRGQVQERLAQDGEAMALAAEIRDLEQRIARYNTLASPVRMTEVLRTIGAFVPPDATATSITMTPRIERSRTAAQPGQPAEEIVNRYMVLELQGYAETDITIASIVAGIDANPLFSSVVLDYSRQRELDGIPVREFRVHSEISLDERYEFYVSEAAQ